MAYDVLLDYETRSEIDLTKAGHWRYASDTSTEVLCAGLAVRLAGGAWEKQGVAVLAGGADGVEAVENRVREAGEQVVTRERFVESMRGARRVVAHNAGFERAITACKFPELEIPLERWSCTMARACRVGLPAALEGLMKVIGGPPKDMEGNRVGLQCAKPRPIWKKKKTGPKWFEDAERLARVAVYCARDIDAEIFADNYLPELDEVEARRWRMVMRENTRGMRIDLDFLEKAWYLVDLGRREIEANVNAATGGEVSNLNSINDIKDFLKQYGIFRDNLRAVDLERYLTEDDTIPATARTVLEGRLAVAKSSIKKLAALKYRVMADGRVRDLQVYHGAHTGRTTGAGPQPLNLPRPGDVDVEAAREAILALDVERLRQCVAPHARKRVIGVTAGVKQARAPKAQVGIAEAVSGALRGVFIPSEGKKFAVCDFAGVETAALMTIAKQQDRLQQIRDQVRLYSVFASQIYGYAVDKNTHPVEDLLGKQGVLSLGYGSGPPKFVEMCAQYQILIDLPLSEKVVQTYRREFAPEVPRLWGALNAASIAAVQNPGTCYDAYGFLHLAQGDWLFTRLPSGRWLHYPGVELFTNRWGRPEISCLKYEKKQLVRKKLYGGLFAENVIQSLCRDAMVEKEELLDADPRFDVIFTCYDEIVCEVPEEIACECLADMAKLMSVAPTWLPEMPLRAEPWKKPGSFYKKE
jgi:DNA polymerase